LDNVLSPRIRALEISLNQLTDHVDALYDVTIAYSNTQDHQTGKRHTPSMFGKFWSFIIIFILLILIR